MNIPATVENRPRLAMKAAYWCVVSVAWATFAGVSALVAGIASSSVALVAFGANSVLDATASAVLVWRFRHERSGGDAHSVERRAAIAVGVVMTLVGFYLAARAVSALAEHHGPESSPFGIALTAAAALVLEGPRTVARARQFVRLPAQIAPPGPADEQRGEVVDAPAALAAEAPHRPLARRKLAEQPRDRLGVKSRRDAFVDGSGGIGTVLCGRSTRVRSNGLWLALALALLSAAAMLLLPKHALRAPVTSEGATHSACESSRTRPAMAEASPHRRPFWCRTHA
jgi:hypothetical protein